MGKSVTTTVGFKYYTSQHLCLCQGPVDAFKAIKVAGKIAWQGNVTANQTLYIDKPELFGGVHREGGFQGYVDVVMGSDTEQPNAYLQNILPDGGYPIPAFRGIAQLVIKDCYVAANNPNLKPIAVKVSRIPCKGWYDAKAQPGTAGGVNGAHIIRELLTNPSFGLGNPAADLDDSSFKRAADTLHSEAFGLVFVWQSEASVHEMIGTVINHIQGSLYIDPFTGLYTLTLVRGDYALSALPSLDDSIVTTIESFERTGIDELVNQVTVKWYDYILDQPQATTVHNAAARGLQGGVVATSLEFAGIPVAELAHRVATRELRKLSTPVARIVFTAKRAAATLKIGDPFKLTDSLHGLVDVPMRVGRIEYGNLDNNAVRIHAVEDIFSFGKAIYAEPTSTLWRDPVSNPAPCPYRRLVEAPYIMVERASNENNATIDAIDKQVGFVTFLGTAPSGDAFSAKLYTRVAGGNYAYRVGGSFCPTAVTVNAVAPAVTSTLDLTGIERLAQVDLGSYAYLGAEMVAVTAITATTVTVNRGILDTVPLAHPAGTRIWFAETHEMADKTQWASGATVIAKALPLTGRGMLALAAAPENSVTITRRWLRPYPPGNLLANGVRWPANTQAAPTTLTWAHRDRTLQISDYVRQDSGSFGPEPGTTYTVKVYRGDGTLVRTQTGLTGLSWAYTALMETADNPGNAIRFDVIAVRDGLESQQANSITVWR